MNPFTNVHSCGRLDAARPTTSDVLATLLGDVADELDQASNLARRIGALAGEVIDEAAPASAELEQLLAQRLVARYLTRRDGRVVYELWRTELWRSLGFSSWRAFADEELGLSKTRAYQLVATGQVCDVLALEISEAQSRPLAPLLQDPELLRAVWERAIVLAGGDEPTGGVVRQAVTELHREPTR